MTASGCNSAKVAFLEWLRGRMKAEDLRGSSESPLIQVSGIDGYCRCFGIDLHDMLSLAPRLQ
jgi:hypothetical protein